MTIKTRWIFLGFIFILMFGNFVSSERQAATAGDLNIRGDILNAYLNVTHTTNGTLKAGINGSFYNFNTTNQFRLTAESNGCLQVTSGLVASTGSSCSSGSESTTTESIYLNITQYLGVGGNYSIIRVNNLTSYQKEADGWKIINDSINWASLYASTGWDDSNTSSYLRDNSFLSLSNATAIGSLIQNTTINRSISLNTYTDTGRYPNIDLDETNNFMNGNWSARFDLVSGALFKLINWTTAFNDRLPELWDRDNDTSAFNLNIQTNLSNNNIMGLDDNVTVTAGLNTKLENGSANIKVTGINITGGVGTVNLTIGNASIWYNGSHICIIRC